MLPKDIHFALHSFQDYRQIPSPHTLAKNNTKYIPQSAHVINSQNPENSYLLLEPIENNKAVVIAGGLFGNVSQKIMTNTYEIIDEAVPIFACHINNIIELVNDWISETGKYFIINPKLLEFHS